MKVAISIVNMLYLDPKTTFTAKAALDDCFVVAVDRDVIREEDVLTALSAGFTIAARNTKHKVGVVKGCIIIPAELICLPMHDLIKAAFGDRSPKVFLVAIPECSDKNLVSQVSHACSILGNVAKIRGIVRVKAAKITVATVDICTAFKPRSYVSELKIAC